MWSNVAWASVRSSSGRSVTKTSWPAWPPASATRRPSMPLAPVTRTRMALEDPDLGVVADHEAVGARLALAAADLDVAPQQRCLHAPVEADHRGAHQEDRVLDLRALDDAVLA